MHLHVITDSRRDWIGQMQIIGNNTRSRGEGLCSRVTIRRALKLHFNLLLYIDTLFCALLFGGQPNNNVNTEWLLPRPRTLGSSL